MVSNILIGFAIVLTPFVIAVATAIVQGDRFAREISSAIFNVGVVSEQRQLLVEEAAEMQRPLGLYFISGDPAFLEI